MFSRRGRGQGSKRYTADQRRQEEEEQQQQQQIVPYRRAEANPAVLERELQIVPRRRRDAATEPVPQQQIVSRRRNAELPLSRNNDDDGGGKFKRQAVTRLARPEASTGPIITFLDDDDDNQDDGDREKKKEPVPDHLIWAEKYGVKQEDLLLVDKLVTVERFKPRDPGTTGRVTHLLARLIKERYLSTRGLAMHLYKCGVKSIWIRPTQKPFYGTEETYLTFMGKRDVASALNSLENESGAYKGSKGGMAY